MKIQIKTKKVAFMGASKRAFEYLREAENEETFTNNLNNKTYEYYSQEHRKQFRVNPSRQSHREVLQHDRDRHSQRGV